MCETVSVNPVSATCNITVGIPTCQRSEKLIDTLQAIWRCKPSPSEVIVHIDAADNETDEVIKNIFPQLKILKSQKKIGPGGGRNRILAEANNPIVVSFDDDSYPIDTDFFGRIQTLFAILPDAAVIGASIYHNGEDVHLDDLSATWSANFVGCGCAYRRDIFNQIGGYVELPLAYGMEEVDLSIRLHAAGYKLLASPWLRVFHNTWLEHHNAPKVTAASVANQLLLTYLRYPIAMWWFGIGQSLNRILWLITNGRVKGIASGLLLAPILIWQHRHARQAVSQGKLLAYLKLRRSLVPPFRIAFDVNHQRNAN